MKMFQDFKNPEDISDSDDLDDLVDENVDEIQLVGAGIGPVIAEEVVLSDIEGDDMEDDSDWSVEFSEMDSQDSDSDESNNGLVPIADRRQPVIQATSNSNTFEGPSSSSGAGRLQDDGGGVMVDNVVNESKILDFNEDDEDDETVSAIIAAIKKPRTSPPEIKIEDFITDICFHPYYDIIALGTITGDVALYKYSNDGNTVLRTIEIHAKACRDVEFSEDGVTLLTCSKDKSIMLTDMETEKLKKFYESAHDEAINKLHIIDENLFATGDDGGTVKLWDIRTKNSIFALKEVEDYISQMLTSDNQKLLLVTSGDGYLTTLNIGARKLYVQSEPYEEELTCMATYRGNSKLITGTSKGRLYSYNWGQFGYHCDMYPGIKTPISVMIPITDRIGCVAGEEGVIRACHIAPYRNLGIVGQHNMPIECMDINSNGELIATSSHNNDVRFWNIKYFEEFGDIKYNEKHNSYKEKRHNLPSSKFTNASDFFADLAKPATDPE